MIRIDVSEESCEAFGPFPLEFVSLVASLSGRKRWGRNRVSFEASGINLRFLEASGLQLNWNDISGKLADLKELEGLATQHAPIEPLPSCYVPNVPHLKHMEKALSLSKDRKVYAYLLEMGLCKTAICIHNAGMLFLESKVKGVLVIAPKGVHEQWAEEQIPEHLDKRIERHIHVWKAGKKSAQDSWDAVTGLHWLLMNTDSIRTAKGRAHAEAFLNKFHGRTMMVVDESHNFKNPRAARTKAILKLGKLADYRRICTGTPIAKSIIDAWAQFMFLDPAILGHNYYTSFRTRYCTMGGFEGRQIIGQKNTEEFYNLIAPHSMRLTKEEVLDLPPKQYITHKYSMSPKTRLHYNNIKNDLLTQFDSGTIVDANNAAVAVLRLQQVVCGYLPDEDNVHFISDERIQILLDIIAQLNGPVVIWARFTHDIDFIWSELNKIYGPDSAVRYYGATSDADRKAAIENWKSGVSRFFVSNPAAGGTGLNLQGDCRNVIYYSNSFNALHRWQSEDRTHRMGTTHSVSYFDIVAKATVDLAILRNLKAKKSLSDLTLDEIRGCISEF